MVIGAAGDAFRSLEKEYGSVMLDFYKKHKFKRGNCPGAAFNGKTLRKMMRPFYLADLKMVLTDNCCESCGESWTQYLSSILEIHTLSVRKELPSNLNYEAVFQNFRDRFEDVYPLSDSLHDTLKIHISSSHLGKGSF